MTDEQRDALVKARIAATELAKAIADHFEEYDPLLGDTSCFYCGSDNWNLEENQNWTLIHTPSCIIHKATAWLKENQ
jgi:hypothetical protein